MWVKWCIVKYSCTRLIRKKNGDKPVKAAAYANICSIDFQETRVKNYPWLHVLFCANCKVYFTSVLGEVLKLINDVVLTKSPSSS